jgi:outer membrane receptor protein involved in Fe transport
MLGVPVVVRAQLDTGGILGTVQDGRENPISEVDVDLKRITTAEVLHTRTGAGGAFRVDRLPAGEYEVTAAAPGYRRETRRGVRVHVGQIVRANFRLVAGDFAETLSSSAQDGGQARDRLDTGQVIDRASLESLPSKTRDFTDLAALAPGASSDGSKGSVKVLGMRSRDNLTYIDGTLFTHGDGAMSFTPSSDAVQEFDVKSGLYSAEYGIRPGAQIVAVIKSGTNQLHGNLFWFHRNDNFDARNFFEQRKSEFKRNQAGATLGGPVPARLLRGTKAWFFLSYQLQSVREFVPLTAVTPTAEEKLGRFSAGTIDPLTGRPFPGGVIPASRFDPVALRLLEFWPAPNTTGPLNFTSPDSLQPLDNPQVIARLDLVSSSRSKWSLRTVWDSSPYASTHVFSRFSTVEPLSSYGQSVANTRLFGRSGVNVTSLHWYRRPYVTGPSQPKPEVPKGLGIPELLQSEADRSGVPTFEVQGYATIGDNHLLGPVNVGNWQVKDDLSFARGRHSVKLGAEFRQHYNFYALQRRSRFQFFNRYSGNAFADFLLGYPAVTALGGEDIRGSFHQNSTYLYLVDEWRWGPRWVLSAGLRYELRLPWRDKRGFMANFDPSTARLVPPLEERALGPWESGRFVSGFPLVEWRRREGFLPRLGIAYRPRESTVVRASYGMYSNEPDLNMLQDLGRNPRPGAERAIFAARLDAPTLLLSNPFPAEARSAAVPTRYGIQTPLPLTITHSWGLAVQQQLPLGVLLQYGYQGSHTVHRLETVSLNDAIPGPGDRQLRRPYPALQAVEIPEADADAWYEGAYLQAEKSPARDGLYLLGSFSWSREIDTAGGYQGSSRLRHSRSVNTPLDATKSTSELQVPKRLLLTARYDLPFGPGKLLARGGPVSRLLQGWRIQSIANLQDGPWFTVYLPGDPLDAGSEYSQWPDRARDPRLDPALRSPAHWFDTSAFVKPPPGRYGNAGRATVQGPGLVNLDASVHRTFPIHESHRLEVRLEVYNALNHPNFVLEDGRTNQFGTPSFGVFGKTLPARQLQVALKYAF